MAFVIPDGYGLKDWTTAFCDTRWLWLEGLNYGLYYRNVWRSCVIGVRVNNLAMISQL